MMSCNQPPSNSEPDQELQHPPPQAPQGSSQQPTVVTGHEQMQQVQKRVMVLEQNMKQTDELASHVSSPNQCDQSDRRAVIHRYETLLTDIYNLRDHLQGQDSPFHRQIIERVRQSIVKTQRQLFDINGIVFTERVMRKLQKGETRIKEKFEMHLYNKDFLIYQFLSRLLLWTIPRAAELTDPQAAIMLVLLTGKGKKYDAKLKRYRDEPYAAKKGLVVLPHTLRYLYFLGFEVNHEDMTNPGAPTIVVTRNDWNKIDIIHNHATTLNIQHSTDRYGATVSNDRILDQWFGRTLHTQTTYRKRRQ